MIKNRYEFVVLFDMENGNPDGDPDAGNLPRIDPENGHDIMTGACLEHKIRNYVEILKEDEPGYKIYIREGVSLSRSDNTAYIEFKTDEKGIKGLERKNPQVDQEIRDFMCRNFFDIRTSGAIMVTFVKAALNCGQVRGSVRLDFARGIDPIVSQKVTIIRVTITTEKGMGSESTEIGRRNIVPCALHRAEGYILANLVRKPAGFSEENLELLWNAIINILEVDHSTTKGKVAVRRLIMFRHSKGLGDCPACELFDAVEIKGNEDVEYPRKYGDYTVTVRRDQTPETTEVSGKI